MLETEIKLNSKYEFSNGLHFFNGLVFNEIGIVNTTSVNAPTFSKIEKDNQKLDIEKNIIEVWVQIINFVKTV